MIGMYESATPPDGWVLCNGSNGTPDLRDYFIKTVSSGNENTTGSGDNTININKTGSVSHSNSHDHLGNYWIGVNSAGYVQGYANSHSHAVSMSEALSYLPPYYALSFIMKAA